MFNVKSAGARQYPQWNTRGRIRKVDGEGNIIPGEYAFNGEIVRISPRFQKHGSNYRVRPERPAAFFAAYAFENGLLPEQLTPQECERPEFLEILEPLFEENKFQFPKLESPFAASDDFTDPSLKIGFSFCIVQVLVEPMGVARTSQAGPAIRGNVTSTMSLDTARKRIEEMRARAAASTPTLRPFDPTAILASLEETTPEPEPAA